MSGTAFSIPRKFNANNFSVGGFYRFIIGKAARRTGARWSVGNILMN